MAKIILLVCALLLAVSVQGCGFLDFKCKAKEAIEQAGSRLIGQAKVAFEQAMDHVFDQDISPLLDKLEAAVDAGIDKVDKDVNETINHVENAIKSIIYDAAQTANALASNLTQDIEQIISKAASAVEQVEKSFYQDASHLLAEINQIVQKGQCMEAGGAKQIQDGIYKLLKALNPYYRVSSCWRSLGYKVTMSLEDLTDIQLYNYQKDCTLLNKITPSTPIEGPGGILETYAQGQLYAAEYYCIGETANAPAFEDVMSKEWLWWGVQYNAWRKIGVTAFNSYHKVKQLRDDPCGTPVECYVKAIEALNEAKQKILGLQTGLLNLNQTVMANQIALKANMSTNRQAISNNTNAIIANQNVMTVLKANVSTNKLAITANTNAIAANKNALTKLKTYPCSCTHVNGLACPSTSLFQGLASGPVSTCCQLCVGTAAEAAAYLRANPVPSVN